MQIYIEQSGEPNLKNVFDKQTKEWVKTVPIHLTYPYPYGYILETKADDGDELDAYVLTDKKLGTSSVHECEVVGMVEWFEDGEADHKILVCLKNEPYDLNEGAKQKIVYFASHFFDNKPEKKFKMGEFLGKDAALDLINQSKVTGGW